MTAERYTLAVVATSPSTIEQLAAGFLPDLARFARVVCFAPASEPAAVVTLSQHGAEFHPIDLPRDGFEPGAQIRTMSRLASLMRKTGTDAVIGLGIDGAAFAALAGQLAQIPRIVSLINEVRMDFETGAGLMNRVRRETMRRLYRMALSRSNAAIFHNREVPGALARLGILPGQIEVHIVNGLGVDLATVPHMALPAINDGVTFLMAAPYDEAYGIETYFQAASILYGHGARAHWLLAGPDGTGSTAIPGDSQVHRPERGLQPVLDNTMQEQELGAHTDAPVIDLGSDADLAAAFERSHVFVVPACPDDMPDAAVQALAVGRPIIALDAPGSRRLVDEGVNGILLREADGVALAEAMARMLKRPDLFASMANASRAKAQRVFDVRRVRDTVINALGLATAPGAEEAGHQPRRKDYSRAV